jgi:hypothetical protein
MAKFRESFGVVMLTADEVHKLACGEELTVRIDVMDADLIIRAERAVDRPKALQINVTSGVAKGDAMPPRAPPVPTRLSDGKPVMSPPAADPEVHPAVKEAIDLGYQLMSANSHCMCTQKRVIGGVTYCRSMGPVPFAGCTPHFDGRTKAQEPIV